MREIFHRFLRPESLAAALRATDPSMTPLEEDYHLIRSTGLTPADQKIVNLWFFHKVKSAGERPSELSRLAETLIETDHAERPRSVFARLQNNVLAHLKTELLLTCLAEMRTV